MAHSRRQRLIGRVVVPGTLVLAAAATVATGFTLGQAAGGEPTLGQYEFATPLPTPTPAAPEAAWGEAGSGTPPDGAALTAALEGLPWTGAGTFTLTVVDPASGAYLVEDSSDVAMVPASNWKVLVAAAVLHELGADHRFETRVVASPGGVVLVGGGDPLLASGAVWDYPARASLADLADQTAAALTAQGTTSIALGYDESYFAGSGWHADWDADYTAYVASVSALMMDTGFTSGTGTMTPAADAARQFSALLQARGITVRSVAATSAGTGETIASVLSPALGVIVQECLRVSDNTIAEVLFRHVGRVSGDGSLAAAQTALKAVLTEMGLWAAGMSAADGSGLSYNNLATGRVIAAAFSLAVTDPAYRAILVGVPVAGGDGTLGSTWRFDDPEEWVGRGVVRAKTGTLGGVASLSGYAYTASGSVLVFSFLTNGNTSNLDAQNWLDRAASLLAAS
jgi:D-alanyl-D-alanine carboxypeptidase/D-alanyl-D-alanine-endopeptidase (penicillin-binding protein 4)